MLLLSVLAAAQQAQLFYAPQPPQQPAFLAPALSARPLPFRAAAEKQAMLAVGGAPVGLDQFSNTVAGVVAVDGGTIGLDVSFAAFLAVILGLFIPVVFLVTLYIQSDAQGTATTFRQPDSIGGTLYEDE